MHTLDTNAIIYYLNGELSAARILDDVFDKEEPIYVSAMTELELFSHRLLTDIVQARSMWISLGIHPPSDR